MLGLDYCVDGRRLDGASEHCAHGAELQQLDGQRDLRQRRSQHLGRRVLLQPSHRHSNIRAVSSTQNCTNRNQRTTARIGIVTVFTALSARAAGHTARIELWSRGGSRSRGERVPRALCAVPDWSSTPTPSHS